jgi:hypothetical protein
LASSAEQSAAAVPVFNPLSSDKKEFSSVMRGAGLKRHPRGQAQGILKRLRDDLDGDREAGFAKAGR